MPTIQLKPLTAALAAAILMVCITLVLPVFFKTWFVSETGNIKILSAFGPVLAFGLLLRWPVRNLSIVLFVIGLAFSLFSLWRAEAPFQAGYALLVVLHVFLLWVLWGDSVKLYLGPAQAGVLQNQ